jgi:hypothetical protein
MDDDNAPPNLQALVAAAGGYEKITAAMWTEFDHALAEWRAQRSETLRREARGDGNTVPEAAPGAGPIEQRWPYQACDHCGAEARFGYRDNSGLRWFCTNHRLARCWADARR